MLGKAEMDMNSRNSHLYRSMLSVFFSSQILSLSMLTPAFSDQGSIVCPKEWNSYVAEIQGLLFEHDLKQPLLFVDRHGNVFDCLGLSPDMGLLKRAELIEKSLPLDRTSVILDDPSVWPTNICSTATVDFTNLQYFSVSLPEDPSVLELPVCSKRVIGGVERILSNLGD